MDKIKQTCRLCLDPVFISSASMDDSAFRNKLATVSNVMFTADDHLPTEVCAECFQKITEFVEFMETVRINQEQLLSSSFSVQIKAEPLQLEEDKEEDDGSSEVKDEEMEIEPDVGDVDESDEDTTHVSETVDKPKAKSILANDKFIKEFFTLACHICSQSFETWRELKSHCNKAHDKEPTLNCCSKTYSSKTLIVRHIEWHRKPSSCEMCGKSFPNKIAVEQHIMHVHTSNEEKPFRCEKCTMAFHKEHLLRSHQKTHVSVDCTICNKTFSSVYTLKVHMTNIHEGGEKCVCDTCGKEFRTRQALNDHVKVHLEPSQKDVEQCRLCDKWFSGKRAHGKHMRTIHGGKEVTCDICHKVYPYEQALQTHKKRVHVEETFECSMCDKKFKRAINLKEHMASHTGQKLYSCNVCGMEMNSNANLYSHKKSKHPYEWMEAVEQKKKMYQRSS